MTSTALFTAGPAAFASARALLVNEPPGLLGALATGANHVIAPMLKHFDFTPFPGAPNTALCNILNAANATSQPCYFLPYQGDTCTTMTLGAGAQYFFTSQLTGCTVQVSGPAATPTVSHANAKTVFMQAAGGLGPATNAAQLAIQAMLPAPIAGQHTTSVTRLTMDAAYTAGNMTAAQNQFGTLPGYRLKNLTASLSTAHGQQRPELGMVVFGVNTPGGWEFYNAVSTSVTGRQKTGKTYFGFININVDNKTIMDGVALGPAGRFWP